MPPDAVPLEADPTHSTHSDADLSHPAYPAHPDADRAPPDLVHPDMDTPGAFGSSASGRGLGARRLQIWRLIIVKLNKYCLKNNFIAYTTLVYLSFR